MKLRRQESWNLFQKLPESYGLLFIVCTKSHRTNEGLRSNVVEIFVSKISSPFREAQRQNHNYSKSFQEVIFLNRSHDFFFIFPQHFTSRNFDKLVAFLFSKLHTALHTRLHMTEGRFNEGIFNRSNYIDEIV